MLERRRSDQEEQELPHLALAKIRLQLAEVREVAVLVPRDRKRVSSDLQLESAYKDIAGEKLVCSKCSRPGDTEGISLVEGVITDLATDSALRVSFNTADENGVPLNGGRTSSPHIPQKYSYQCTECKFRKRKLAAVKNHIRKFHADSPKLPIRKDCPRGQGWK